MSSFTEGSPFTEYNGPAVPGQQSILKLIKELQEAVTALQGSLNTHTNSTVDSTAVHSARSYINGKLAEKANNSDLANLVTTASMNNAIELAVRNKQNTLTFDVAPTAGSLNPVESNGIYSAIQEVIGMLEGYQTALAFDDAPTAGSANPVKSDGVYTAITNVISSLNTLASNFNITNSTVSVSKALKSTNRLIGRLNAKDTVDFTDWTAYTMPYAGIITDPTTNTSGAFILGMLSDDWSDETGSQLLAQYRNKPCRVYLKIANNHYLDAVLDCTATYDGVYYNGSITASVTREADSYESLGFYLYACGDATGTRHVYVCMGSSSFANYNNYPLEVRSCGINFIPVGATGYIAPVNIGEESDPFAILACPDSQQNGLFIQNSNTVSGTINEATIQLVKGETTFEELPLVQVEGGGTTHVATESVTDTIVPIGAMLRWPDMTAVPERYHATDGTTVSATSYPVLAELLGSTGGLITLPVENNSIIRLY